MQTNKKRKAKRPHKYDIMPHSKRMSFIDMVIKQKCSVYRAAKVLSINNSTAKAIMRSYKKTGHVYICKGEQNLLEKQEQLSPLIQNGAQSQLLSVKNDNSEESQRNIQPQFCLPLQNQQVCYFFQYVYATPFWML